MSTKSRSELELQAMKAERDHWRAKAKERAGELEAVRQENARLRIHKAAFSVDTVLPYDDALNLLQQEREEWKQVALRGANAIRTVLDVMYDTSLRTKEHSEHYLRELIEKAKPDESLYIATVFQAIASQYSETAKQINGKLLADIIEYTGSDDFDALHNPELCLQKTLELNEITHLWRTTIQLALYGYQYAGDKSAIAWEIIDQARHGEISIRSLNLLGEQWLKDNLPGKPGKCETVQQGLLIFLQERESGKTREEFARQNGYSARRLQTYQSWYEALEEQAKKRPTIMFEGIAQN